MLFWREIKRRHVFQVAIAYLAVAWLVTQIVSIVAEPLNLPPWFETAVILLVALGFPVAIVLAWALELTPKGIERTSVEGKGAAESRGDSSAALAMTAVVAASIGASGAWFLLKEPDRSWILEDAIPQIESFVDTGDFESAHRAVNDALAEAPGDSALTELLPRISWTTSIRSEPAGSQVFRRAYNSDPETWEFIGTTPLENVRIPYGLSRLRFEYEGRPPVLGTIGSGVLVVTDLAASDPGQNFAVGSNEYRLDTADTLDNGAMVRVPAWTESIAGQIVEFNDFFLGRYEVTNSDYKEFVDAGGYRQENLWRELDEAGIDFEEAMVLFVDSTGQRGPATWRAGDYVDGQENFPVAGVSWYEAAAYARFRGQELPTVYHYRRAVAPASYTWTLPASNFGTETLREVGAGDAMSWIGAYDLTGNVREWVTNPSGEERLTVGGSAADAPFVGTQAAAPASPLDRSGFSGFRTMRVSEETAVMTVARAALPPPPAFPPHQPVSDEVYEAWSVLFDYPAGPLDADIEPAGTTRNWKRERISFNVPYSNERMVLYLYLPTIGSPPYQTVVYWPGSAATLLTSIDDYTMNLDFVVKSGRAVAFPVYKGTFERGGGVPVDMAAPEYRDTVIETVKDLQRSMDYLETRSDLDQSALAFYGHSWGAVNGATALAQESRFDGAVIYVGFPAAIAPEVHPLNALPRVSIPVLMLSGLFDPLVPIRLAETYFDAIGTPDSDKRHVKEPGGHFVARDILIEEVLGWLDEQFGNPLAN